MSRHRPSTPVLATILAALLTACGVEDSLVGIEPLEADFVLSVFELEASARGPCAALTSLPGVELGEGSWEAVFPTQKELLEVLDCRWEGQDVLYEGTGRLMGGMKNRVGWELFARRTTTGGMEFAISGQGEGEVVVGLRGGERVAWIELDTQHQSSTHSVEGSLRYEGPWPSGRLLLMHRRVGERANAPWVCVAIELH